MERTEEALRERVRETPLSERLKTCEKYIASMCAERRPPKMTIPLQHYDEDFYICTTLADAQATIAAVQARVQELEDEVKSLTTYPVHSALPPASYLSHAKTTKRSLRHDVPTCYSCDLPWPCQASLLEKELRSLYAITTQRTAELEAAKADRDEAIREHGKESGFWGRSCARLLDKNKHLQAELERLKGREENMMHGECDICGSCEHVRHINLYVSGSEGLTVCTECEMHIVTYVRSLRQITAKVKLRMVKFYKDQQERLKKVEP